MEQNVEIKDGTSNRRISPQYATVLFPTIMAISMSFVMSLVITIIRLGFVPQLMSAWLTTFAIGAPVAIPTAILVSPFAQRLARAMRRPKYTPLLIPAIMVVMMSLTMSFVMTTIKLGFGPNLIPAWLNAFTIGLIIGLPAAILIAPQAKRLVSYLTGTPLC